MLSWTSDQIDARNREVFGVPSLSLDVPLAVDLMPTKPRTNKYGVAPKEERTIGLLTFASKAEAHAYQKLLILTNGGGVEGIELQPVFKFPMGFEYRADFRVTYTDGSVEVIDVKGVETPVFKLKAKCMAHFYPEVRLSLWSMRRK